MSPFVIAGSALVLALICLVFCLRQLLRMRRLERQLTEIMAQPVAQKIGEPSTRQTFSAHLNTVEQLQASSEQRKPAQQTEKYRYAVALASQGYTVEGIATALQMAPAEVEQIVQLSRLKRHGEVS